MRLKRSEKAAIAVMRASGLWIKYRAKIDKVGRREERIVLIVLTVAASLPSE
jgi:hypothetical protein